MQVRETETFSELQKIKANPSKPSVVACIVYWQAREISRAISECDPEVAGVDLSLLERVSPIEWDNVVLYGQYVLDRKRIRRRRAKHLRLLPKSKPPKEPVGLGSCEGPEC